MKRQLALLALILLAATGLARAQDTVFVPDEALEAQMADLEAGAAALRGLEAVEVEHAFPTRADTLAYLTEQFDRQLPLDELGRYLNFYVALDLLEPDIDLRAVYLELLGQQIAGFYDTDTGVMNVLPLGGPLGSALSPLVQLTYVHEYAHALQDVYFGLDQFTDEETLRDDVDRAMAYLALVEGDATVVMTLYTQQLVQENPLAALQVLGESLQAGGLTVPPGTPPILARELLFPYEGGMTFILALLNEGGWDAVNKAYTQPPTASEHILHPQAYIDGELPAEVDTADATDVLGEGWERQWHTPLGEWYLREHLRMQLDSDQAADGAAGWNGDRFDLYANEGKGELAWLLRVAWDTPADRDEFEKLYDTFAGLRYGAESVNGCWSDDRSATCMAALDGDMLVARAPSQRDAAVLLAAQT